MLRSSPMARRSTVNRGDGGSTPPFAAKVTLRARTGARRARRSGRRSDDASLVRRRDGCDSRERLATRAWSNGTTRAFQALGCGFDSRCSHCAARRSTRTCSRRPGEGCRSANPKAWVRFPPAAPRALRASLVSVSVSLCRPGARASSADCNPASLGCDSPPGLPGVLRRSLAAVAQWLGTWLSPRPVRVRFPSVAPRRPARRACGHRLAVRTAVSRTANEGSIPSDHAAASTRIEAASFPRRWSRRRDYESRTQTFDSSRGSHPAGARASAGSRRVVATLASEAGGGGSIPPREAGAPVMVWRPVPLDAGGVRVRLPHRRPRQPFAGSVHDTSPRDGTGRRRRSRAGGLRGMRVRIPPRTPPSARAGREGPARGSTLGLARVTEQVDDVGSDPAAPSRA